MVVSPLEQFQLRDGPQLVELTRSVGWRHSLEDWATTLASGSVFGHRGEDGRIISSSAVYLFGECLASLGFVLVRPEARRRGLAQAAVSRCLEVAGTRSVFLVATPEGEPLYRGLGFVTVESLHSLTRASGSGIHADGHCRPMGPADLRLAFEIDRQTFGADRKIVLQNRCRQSVGTAILSGNDGFAWTTFTGETMIAGPVVAPDAEAAYRLIGHLLAGQAVPLRIDVFASQERLIARLLKAGFAKGATRPLMLWNGLSLPGRRERLFAPVSLAFG